MEEGVRSGERLGGLVKKKSSSGCLIIKKKGDGMSGVSGSVSRKVFDLKKEKKRPRMILSDSGSSDELLEPIRRKVIPGNDKFRNGSAVRKKGFLEDSIITRNGEIESERKRSRLDVFEFDEYDGFDGKKMRNDYMDDRLRLVGRSENQREFGTGSSRNVMVDKRKHSYFDGTSSILDGRNKGRNHTSRFEMEEDEAHLPISLLREKFREASDEPIRFQGKNGVLKVMVNTKKKPGLSHKSYGHQEAEDRKGSRSEDAIKKNILIRPSFYSDSKRPEKPVSFVRTEKSELKLQKSLSAKSSKAEDSETDDSDTSMKLASTSVQACSSRKGVKDKRKRTPSTENITPIRGKEGKVKRSSGTEKQLLRERIRNMLISAGWTIDYRPRRNRDYLDAVYINPTGTAYWSIIKAYDALQKQLDEEDDNSKQGADSSPFTPLSEEILSKLTRQTRKKIEKEMKKKRRDNGGSNNSEETALKESAEGGDSDQHEEKLSFYMRQNGKCMKGRQHEADLLSGDDSSDNLYTGRPKQDGVEKAFISTNSHMIQGRKSRKIGRCTLLVRSSDKGLNSETDGFVPYTGKRTLLSWLIDSGMVHLSEKVQYMKRRKTRVLLEGWITRDGIHCGCCSKILTVSKFELHAGTKLRQPFQNIFLESGVSLLQCQIDAWNRQEESECRGFYTVDTDGDDPNDDTCGICGDGGDLICCDGCPSTFHLRCLDLKMLPPGDWHCPNCTCKFCGIAGGSIAEGKGKAVNVLLVCDFCEKKYHKLCGKGMRTLPADSSNAPTSFCGQKCRELYDHLQKLLGVKHELEAGFSWSLIHRTDIDTDTSHRGFPQRVECNSKLAVALSVMDECFLPITDRRRINLIHNVLYNCGSNFSRLNYSGFYTAILERGDEIISAASIRIHGTQLAEMPFIGTRHIYRRQGMCRRLLCAIESALYSLRVEKLIIPAIAEHMHTWTAVFGFSPLDESHKQELKSMNMLVFPGTDMLQKLLMKQEVPEGNVTASSGTKSVELKDNHPLSLDLAKKSGTDSSGEHDLHTGNDAALQHVNKISDKIAATESGLQAPAVPSDESSMMSSPLDASLESKHQLSSNESISISYVSVNKLAESASDLKHPSPSDAIPIILEMYPLVDPPIKDNILSSGKGGARDEAHNGIAEVSSVGLVPDSLGETSARNMAEGNENQNSVSLTMVLSTDESTMQFNSDLTHLSTVEMESKLHVTSKVASDTEVEPFEDKSDAREMNSKVASEPVPVSLLEISGETAIEKVSENQKPVSASTASGIGEDSMQFSSDLNQPSALGTESLLHVASECICDAEVACDAKVASVEDNIQTSTVCDDHDAKVACVESSLDSLDDISAQNTAEEFNENQNLASSVPGADDNAVQFNSDSNQSELELEKDVPVASEFGSEAKVACTSNIQCSRVGYIADDSEVNVKLPCAEPVLDSTRGISPKNTAEEINEHQNPVSLCTYGGLQDSVLQLNPDLNQQTALEVESELLVTAEVVSSEVIAPAESNIQSDEEGKAGDADEVNVKIAGGKPTFNSLGETSAQNTVEEVDEKLIESNSDSGGSSVQFKSVLNCHSAPEMESELHVAPEVASHATPSESNILHPSHEN